MSTTQIVSKRLHVTNTLDFVDDVTEYNAFYVFAARHIPFAGGDTPVPIPTDTIASNYIDIYNDMLFGKKVSNTDITPMAPRHDWTSNTVYAMYDDTDANLYSKAFYATVNTGSQYHVYKCLYNDGNTASTVEPSGTDADSFETSDGYIWKYICSANDVTMAKFATADYMPIVPNTSIAAAATPGSIEVIKVEDGGVGYNNYIVAGHFETAADVRVGGSGYQYGLGASASTLNDFYRNCLLKITSGAAAGEYRVITAYTISGGVKIATLDAPFTGVVAVNDEFEVYPFVDIFDTGGSKQTNCIARAIISNTSSNSVASVEVLAPGSGYRSATAIIRPANSVGVSTTASLRPIMSPPDGHGANAYYELGSNYAGISVKFIENEGVAPELRTENDFRQIGLLRDPLFANVQIAYSAGNTVGSFLPAEKVLQYTSSQLVGTVNTFSNSTIVGSNSNIRDSLSVGARVLITDGISNVFGNVQSIPSNTSIVLDVNASFTSTSCNIALVSATDYGIISANSSGVIYLSNVQTANVSTSNKFVGEQSFATTIADTVKICRGGSTPDVRSTNNFVTFSQLIKLAGTIDSGTFTEDEVITQDSAMTYDQPSARLYAAIEAGTVDYLYVTNVQNVWQTGAANGVATGQTSDAQFTVTNKYDGELVPGSGQVLYIENLSPISRSNTQSETIKLILEL